MEDPTCNTGTWGTRTNKYEKAYRAGRAEPGVYGKHPFD
jgi:hypothetical protein